MGMDFCSRFEPAMDRAIAWLTSQDRDGDGLIENHYLAGWMDSILKKDKVFYLNLTYYEGLRACQLLKEWLGHAGDARRFAEAAARTHERLQQVPRLPPHVDLALAGDAQRHQQVPHGA